MNNKMKIQERCIKKQLRLQKELEEYESYSNKLPEIISDVIKTIIIQYGMLRIKEKYDDVYEDALHGLRFKNESGAFLIYTSYDRDVVRIAVDRTDTFNKFYDSYLDITLTQNSKKKDYQSIYDAVLHMSSITYKEYFEKDRNEKDDYINNKRK